MEYSYILHKYAQQDYEQSLKWYAERSIDAAEKFVMEIDGTLKLVCADPHRWRNKYKSFCEINLNKYPFTIIYTIEDDKKLIVISSVYHHKRNPNGKYRKINS